MMDGCLGQVFRHLHVLASEKRCVETIDVKSRDPLHLSIKVSQKQVAGASATDLLLRTPCLTPELNSVSPPRPHMTGKQQPEAVRAVKHCDALDSPVDPTRAAVRMQICLAAVNAHGDCCPKPCPVTKIPWLAGRPDPAAERRALPHDIEAQ